MQDRIKTTLEQIQPVLDSIGSKASVVGASEGIATIHLEHAARVHAAVASRVREFVEREVSVYVPEIIEVKFEEEWEQALELSPPQSKPEAPAYTIVDPDEQSDTFLITFDRSVGPVESKLYDSSLEAGDSPLAQALFKVPNIASVLIKDKMAVVSRNAGNWPAIVAGVRAALDAWSSNRAAASEDVDEQAIWDKVWKLLDEQINPSVASHGGVIQLVEVKGSEIYLHMGGGCQGCGMASVTLSQGVEQAIRQQVPEVTAVHDSTDHAGGHNPYFG